MLVPRWRRIAATVSADPPVAEIATTRVSGDGGCGSPVEASSAYASTPVRAQERRRVEGGVAGAAHAQEEHPPRPPDERLHRVERRCRRGEHRGLVEDVGEEPLGVQVSHAPSISQRIPPTGAYIHSGRNAAA